MKIGDCFSDDYVVVDVETSGLDPSVDRVLEIGVLVVRNREIQQPAISWVLNPNFPDDGFEVPAKITELTGITTEEVTKKGADPALVLPKLQDICNEKMIFSHNGIRFDRLFLDEENKRFGLKASDKHQFLDTAALFKGWRLGMLGLLEELNFYDFANRVLETRAYGVYFNLPYCCKVLEIDTSDLGDAHRAGVDVVMTHRVMEQLRGVLVGSKRRVKKREMSEEVMIRYKDVNGRPNRLCKVSKSEEEAREWFEKEHPNCEIVEVRWRNE